MNRRQLLKVVSLGALTSIVPEVLAAAKAKRLLIVHGRGKAGQDPSALKAEWVDALNRGLRASRQALPGGIDIAFPYYGDALERFTREAEIPLTTEMTARGTSSGDEFLVFQAEFAEAVRERAGVTDAQVDAEYGTNPRPRGPLNWEWVQAILRAVNKHGGRMGAHALETF